MPDVLQANRTSSSGADRPTDTRLRLLEAAGAVFADRGFEHATIRDICRLADANIASVKYHFGNKTELYRATMRHHIARSFEKFPAEMELPPDPTPRDRLRGFIRGSVHRILDESPDAIHGRLMAREMVEPTPALDDHVAEVVRPLSDRLREIVLDLRPDLDEPRQRRMMGSIIGQILFYKHCRPVMDKLFPGHASAQGDLEALAEHIVAFSLAGLGVADASEATDHYATKQ